MHAKWKNCCSVLSRTPKQIDLLKFWLIISCLMSTNVMGNQYQHTSFPLSLQRRFMWKQVDHTMGGLMDGMATGARAMKNMFNDLLPTVTTTQQPVSNHMHSNVLDYLPSETTRVKYIIRNPTTSKIMKVIKIRSPKNHIKVVTVAKPIVEGKLSRPKTHFPTIEKLRQMEKEQEMIAEGRLPRHHTTQAAETEGKESPQGEYENNELIAGKTHYPGEGWTPVYGGAKQPNAFTAVRPHAVSELHTSIMGESLPEPEKQVQEEDEDAEREESQEQHSYKSFKRPHTYEVTEYTAEESVALPLTQQDHRDYRISRGYMHTAAAQPSAARISATASTTTTTTTTEEAPNYPIAYLKKQRERLLAASSAVPHTIPRFQVNEAIKDTSWIPVSSSSNVAPSVLLRARLPTSSQAMQAETSPSASSALSLAPHQKKNVARKTNDKWAPLLVPAPHPFLTMTSTEIAQKSTQQSTQHAESERPLRKLKTNTGRQQEETIKPKEKRQRGSVKFGDKISLDQYK